MGGSRAILVLCFGVVGVLGPMRPLTVGAHEPTGSLTRERWSAGLVRDGSKAYLFGGEGARGTDGSTTYLDTIELYDAVDRTTKILETRLSLARTDPTAVLIDGSAYIIGGSNGSSLGIIERYDLSSGNIETENATLEVPVTVASAVAIDGKAYIFGGYSAASTFTDVIQEYDPVGDKVTVLAATLPGARGNTAAAVVGSSAFVFGGANYESSTFIGSDQIVEFDPASSSVAVREATLPLRRYGMSAAPADGVIYASGGAGESPAFQGSSEVLAYDPAADEVSTVATPLPSPRAWASSFWDGASVVVLGGRRVYDRTVLSEIVRIDPAAQHDPAPAIQLTRPRGDALYVADVEIVTGSRAEVIGPVTLRATAGPNVVDVRFYIDRLFWCHDTSAPFECTWSRTSIGRGVHTVLAVAKDAGGHEADTGLLSVTVTA